MKAPVFFYQLFADSEKLRVRCIVLLKILAGLFILDASANLVKALVVMKSASMRIFFRYWPCPFVEAGG
jgi:hypothetical protein